MTRAVSEPMRAWVRAGAWARRRVWWAVAAVVVGAAIGWLRCSPLPAGLLLDRDAAPSTLIVDRAGERLYEVRSDLGTRGEALDAGALPRALVSATLAAEDVRFRAHIGVDPLAMVRAAYRDLRAGRVAEGGSTITQQVAKLLLARQDGGRAPHGWTAKVREAVMALRLEHRLTKNAILALYLNLAPYGNQIDGAARAARAYFGRDVATLTPSEAAFLAALPQQPSRFNPWREPARARVRQAHILLTMAEHGWLSATDYDTARHETLALSREVVSAVAPHFVEHVLAQVGVDRPHRIETTLDAQLERTIEGIIAAHRRTLDAHHAANVAIAVLDNRTNEWIGWEGSGNSLDAAHGGTIDGIVTPRQPGSALKPFTYAAAFERGYHPGRVLADVPSQFPTSEPGILYSPRNYDGAYRGPLLARAALAGSENVPAVALASQIGVPAIARLLRRVGLTTLGHDAAYYGLGLTLGNAEVRLDELVAAYAMLARGGEFVAPRAVRAIDGRPVPAGAAERVVSARTAFWITDILSDSEARAYVFGRGGSLEFPFPVAAKTGTSQAYHDNWAIGYTRDLTVGVWVGNFDRSPLTGSSGVTGAGPIFHDVMIAAIERTLGALPSDETRAIVAPTANVRRVELCAVSGLRPTDACPTRVTEWVPAEATLESCTWHHASDAGLVTVWPDEYRLWARSEGLLGDATRDAGLTVTVRRATGPSSHSRQSTLTIAAPLAGAVYLLDPTLRAAFQMLPLEARGGAPGSLEWFVDGASVGTADPDTPLRWPLSRGAHAITVRDASGHATSTSIVVR
jgi:penicillin-binding protein 1C